MRSRLLGGQVSSRSSDRASIRVSRSAPRSGRGSFARPALIAAILALTALAMRAGFPAGALLPTISAESAIVLDLESGKELLSKNADTRIYPASLTKLMTALILADSRSPGDLLRCSGAASLQEPTRLGLFPGSRLTAVAVMDAMLVGSANDAAYMVAEDVGGSVRGFAALMNSKAKALGMDHSNFVTPNGLHEQNHYSTARDLAILLKTALQDPWVSKSLSKVEASVTASVPQTAPDGASPASARPAGTSSAPATFSLQNTNPLLGQDGCTAGKTGSTSQAGKCLAALYERDGRRVIAVVMGAPTTEALVEDMRAVVDAALRK